MNEQLATNKTVRSQLASNKIIEGSGGVGMQTILV